MAGKINRQVKSGKPILVNGYWVHQSFVSGSVSLKQIARMAEIAKRLNLHSA